MSEEQGSSTMTHIRIIMKDILLVILFIFNTSSVAQGLDIAICQWLNNTENKIKENQINKTLDINNKNRHQQKVPSHENMIEVIPIIDQTYFENNSNMKNLPYIEKERCLVAKTIELISRNET